MEGSSPENCFSTHYPSRCAKDTLLLGKFDCPRQKSAQSAVGRDNTARKHISCQSRICVNKGISSSFSPALYGNIFYSAIVGPQYACMTITTLQTKTGCRVHRNLPLRFNREMSWESLWRPIEKSYLSSYCSNDLFLSVPAYTAINCSGDHQEHWTGKPDITYRSNQACAFRAFSRNWLPFSNRHFMSQLDNN